METPISQHLGLYQNFDSSKMHFFALEHIPLGIEEVIMTSYSYNESHVGYMTYLL